MDAQDTQKAPDRSACLELLERLQVLPHIRDHSLVVCDLALHIARLANTSGSQLNLADIEAAALLHDITKTASLATGENHALTGAALVRGLGYHRIAAIIAAHIEADGNGSALTEDEVVCYADKRVLHDRVVSLGERFVYLRRRYGTTPAALTRIRAQEHRIRAIERKLRAQIPAEKHAVLGCAAP